MHQTGRPTGQTSGWVRYRTDVRLIDLACSGRSVVLLLWRKGRHEGFNLPCPMLT